MKWIENTFLTKLYRTDKILFAVVIIFCLGILYGCRLSREEFPFLLYGMYSLKEEPKQFYNSYAVEIDSQQISLADLSDSKKELIMTTIANAAQLYDAKELRQIEQYELTQWVYALYHSSPYKRRDKTADIYRIVCSFDLNGRPVVLKKEALFNEP